MDDAKKEIIKRFVENYYESARRENITLSFAQEISERLLVGYLVQTYSEDDIDDWFEVFKRNFLKVLKHYNDRVKGE